MQMKKIREEFYFIHGETMLNDRIISTSGIVELHNDCYWLYMDFPIQGNGFFSFRIGKNFWRMTKAIHKIFEIGFDLHKRKGVSLKKTLGFINECA